jgi:NCS2 family nucleobase:cation symporter-2
LKKPADVAYGVEDRPPVGLTLLSAVQQIGVMSVYFIVPLLVGREGGLPVAELRDLLSVSILVIGVGAVLQALPQGPIGSGFLCPPVFTAIYIGPSLAAVRQGGLPLVCGMTLFASAVELALARIQRYLRPFFPPEISGLVVVLVALTIGTIGMRDILSAPATRGVAVPEIVVAAVTLATMLALSVWTRGFLHAFCALIGMSVGYTVAAAIGLFPASEWLLLRGAPLLSLPHLSFPGWTFDSGLALPFAVSGLAAYFKVVANVTTSQKMNDAEWVRPDIRSISGGAAADALGSVVAGLLGTVGVNSSTSAVGVAGATGVTSRSVAYAIGGVCALLAILPKLTTLLAIMPRPVVGATALFAACFVFVSGLRILTSRMLDARRTFVIGLSFMIGTSVDLYPTFFAGLPALLRPFVDSALVLGTLSAFILNLVFRIGVRRVQRLVADPNRLAPERIHEFMEAQGAAWGARRDVIDRATFTLTQSVETIVGSCKPEGPVEVEASFDEFNLDLRVSYTGVPLELPEQRPTNREIMESEEGERRLAGFLLRRQADRVLATSRVGRVTLSVHFDH